MKNKKFVKMKNKKFLILFCVIFIGVAFLVGGIIFHKQTVEFKNNGVKITAEIVSIQKEPDTDVLVKYTVGNTTYTNDINTYSSFMYVGQEIEIYYLPNNPNKIAYLKSLKVVPIVCFGISGLVLGITLIVYLVKIIKNFKLIYYKKNGNEVLATLIGIDVNKLTSVLGKHPAIITLKDNFGNIYTAKVLCRSEKDFAIRSTATVYVDRYNLEKYAVDVKTLITTETLEKNA